MPRFTQCNLCRSKTATAELAAPADDDISDVLLRQEPYLDQSGCMGGLPKTWRIIHKANAKAGIVIRERKASASLVHLSYRLAV